MRSCFTLSKYNLAKRRRFSAGVSSSSSSALWYSSASGALRSISSISPLSSSEVWSESSSSLDFRLEGVAPCRLFAGDRVGFLEVEGPCSAETLRFRFLFLLLAKKGSGIVVESGLVIECSFELLEKMESAHVMEP